MTRISQTWLCTADGRRRVDHDPEIGPRVLGIVTLEAGEWRSVAHIGDDEIDLGTWPYGNGDGPPPPAPWQAIRAFHTRYTDEQIKFPVGDRRTSLRRFGRGLQVEETWEAVAKTGPRRFRETLVGLRLCGRGHVKIVDAYPGEPLGDVLGVAEVDDARWVDIDLTDAIAAKTGVLRLDDAVYVPADRRPRIDEAGRTVRLPIDGTKRQPEAAVRAAEPIR